MRPRFLLRLLALVALLSFAFAVAVPAQPDVKPTGPVVAPAEPDADGDGLADFHEVHKYGTDPKKKDTAGKGTPDGDWQQRREFAYSVRAVIRVMPPYNLKAMHDDYQDVKVLAETKDYAELEVVAYPLNTNAKAITANANWKKDYAGMKEYLAPGVTTNWDAKMQKDLLAELKKSGIDPDALTDREVVERVSKWLYGRASYKQMFCTHFVHFPGGKPEVAPGLNPAFKQNLGNAAWSAEEQFAHELLGKEMFYHKTYGSCTSAAVYQATVLRAVGLPTRMVIAIPLADSSDPAQVAMVAKGLTHNQVRQTALQGLLAAGDSYTAHTFLEVYVGGRWRRLNYSHLGQNIVDANYLGLMIHVHTFNDLSEAGLAATWGRRYALGQRDKVFAHSNPYRTMAVTDHFGKYAQVPNPPAKEHKTITLGKIYWADAKDAPAAIHDMPAGNLPPGTGRLFVHGEEWFDGAGDYLQYKLFFQRADKDFVLKAKGRPDVKCHLTWSFVTHASQKVREMEVLIPPAEFAKMARGVAYTLHPVNAVKEYHWKVKDGLTITRGLSLEEKFDAILERLDKLEKRVEELEKKKGGS